MLLLPWILVILITVWQYCIIVLTCIFLTAII
jgi:hypothetical protein